MITVMFNETKFELEKNIFLNEFLEKINFKISHFAIAINMEFIPKARYATTLLRELDTIITLSPMQGG